MILKNLLIIIVVLLLTGCFSTPVEPEPEVSPIICEGGYYSTKYTEWSPVGCPGTFYPAGTYWYNTDGRIFLLGDPVSSPEVFDIYGECPSDYIEEIF